MFAILLLTLWGNLQPGPYATGYTKIDRIDASRPYRTARMLDGTPRAGERARPIAISIWYPAQVSDATPLTFGDYARDEDAAIFGLQGLPPMTEAQRAKIRALPGRAVRDAKPAAGKFPLILYSLGSPAPAFVTPEYLASHGYVVVQAPRLGATAGSPPESRELADLDTKLRDMDFVIDAMRDFPSADTGNMGAIGFSAGGRWALAAAMKSQDVHAVVSLDSVMLFEDRLTAGWRTLPHFNLDAVRVPVLHLTRAEFAKNDNPKMWEGLRYADRTVAVFDDPKLIHWDFQSLGYALALGGARGDDAASVEKAFHAWNRETLAFLDAALKGGAYKPSTGTRTAALPAPITIAEFLNAVTEDGADAAIAAVRNTSIDEAAVNLAGYNLLFGGRAADGLKLLVFNAEAHPQSANAFDSLGDAYVATGDRAKALEAAKKANELLKNETALPPERRAAIQGSIDQKIKVLTTSP